MHCNMYNEAPYCYVLYKHNADLHITYMVTYRHQISNGSHICFTDKC